MNKKTNPQSGNEPNKADNASGKAEKDGQGQSGFSLKDWVAPFLGVIMIAIYVWYLVSLKGGLANIDNPMTEILWSRNIYLLGGLEAIVFSVVGYFFGTAAARQQVEAAKKDKEEAKEEAVEANERTTIAEKQAVKDQTNGTALKAAILAKSKSQTSKRGSYGSLGGEGAANLSKTDFEELATLAKELFPE